MGVLLMLAGPSVQAQEWKRGEDTVTLLVPRDAPSAAATNPILLPVMTYRYGGAPKPYVKELFTPAGVQVLLDSPPDHVHHRGLMFAVAIDGVNFWEESPTAGRQQSQLAQPVPLKQEQRVYGAWDRVQWVAPDGRNVADELRILLIEPHAEFTLVHWISQLQPSAPATLTGNHYFGLGMRFVRAMDERGEFFTPDSTPGEVVRGDEKLYSGRWCAYLSDVDGKPVTVAMFDHPGNPRPATWFTMARPFAYLSATLRLHQEPLAVGADRSLQLKYGIAVWDGHVGRDAIEVAYKRDYLHRDGITINPFPTSQAEKPADEVKP
jgi:hypothetical protein